MPEHGPRKVFIMKVIYVNFEKEFGQIEAMKGEFQSLETENLLMSAAAYAEVIEMPDLAAERIQKFLDTTKFSPSLDILLAKGTLGKKSL